MNHFDSSATVPREREAAPAARRVVPSTESQREIWLGDRLGGEASASFNLSKLLRLSGLLDQDGLRLALDRLVSRHDALRAGFSDDGESMFVLPSVPVELEVIDLCALADEERTAAAMQHLRARVEQPFVLESAGLFRFHLVRLDVHQHLLLLCAHHIVCDGWSWGVLVRELGQLYSQATGFGTAGLPAPESFADFALRQAKTAHSADQDDLESYWLSRFPGIPPVLDLPCDRPRGQQRSFASARVDHLLGPDLVEDLRQLGARQRSGLFAVLLAGYALLLSRLSGDGSVVVGVPAAGQTADDREGLVGNCVNLLPVRLDVDPEQGFGDLLGNTRSHLLDALDHQGCTFGSLLRRLPIVRDPGRMPLVSVLLNLEESADAADVRFGGLDFEVVPLPRRQDAFEVFLNAVRLRDGGIRLECQFNADFFDGATVSGWLCALEALLRGGLSDAASPVAALPLVTDATLAALRALQPAPTPFAADLLMHERFERQCDRTPGRLALRHEHGSLTYAELEARANAIAHRLRGVGMGEGDRVGVAVERGADMLAAVLGVLKCGAAYVPLDPGFPEQRLSFMVEDAALGALLTCRSLQSRFLLPGRRVLLADEDASASATATPRLGRDSRSAGPESCAYVIYTSGSTGQPKGVCVPHRAVANFLEAMVHETGISPDDRLVAVTTLSFDIAVLELLLPGCVGAQVVLAGQDTATDGHALRELLARSQATLMQGTPSTWRLLLDAGWSPDPGFVMLCGGEPLAPALASRLLERGSRLFNVYGPTETTVWSTCARIAVPPAGERPSVDIGRPIANTQVWVLDRNGNLLPPGVPGELCIGGAGVTLGYHQRPELTAERFIPDRHSGGSAGSILYRTGDRGRWRGDGRLEHLGRLDHQVKLRGFRIELGEIEFRASNAPGVDEAVAIVREMAEGDARLVLYVVTSGAYDPGALLATLRSSLPDYMLPQHVVPLQAFPRLPNGKLDRRALPDPQAHVAAPSEAPRTATERAITEAMAEVLGMRAVGVHDDFFAHGGHSLLAAQLTARLNRTLGAKLPWRALFDARTPARLAEMADAGGAAVGGTGIPARPSQVRAPLTPAQDRLRQLEELQPGRGNFCLPSAHRLKGRLDRDALDRAFALVVRRQAVLRTVIPAGPSPHQHVLEDFLATRIEQTVDLSERPDGDRESRLQATLATEAAQGLDICARPPFRAQLIRLADDDHVLFFMAHHILWDGWSTHLLLDELGLAYQAMVDGRDPRLPDLPVSFGDYAQHHLDWLAGPEYARQRDYWQAQHQLGEKAPALRRDNPMARGTTGRSGMRPIVLGDACTDALRAVALSNDATLFMALLAVWYAVLHARSGPGDLVVGSPVRGRNHADLEHLMGFFTSLLPLRARISDEMSFSMLLRQTRTVVLEAFSHPDVLLEDLLPAPGRRAAASRPLYHALLSYQDARGRHREWGGLVRERIPMHPATTAEDLGVWFVEYDEGLWGQLIFNADAFEPATADDLRERFLAVALAAAADPLATVGELSGGRSAHGQVATGTRPPPPADSPAALTRQGQVLAGLFADVLGVEDVGPGDNFFALGGNSLLALHLIKRVQTATGVRLNLVRLATGTVGSLSRDLPEPTQAPPPKAAGWRGLFARRRD